VISIDTPGVLLDAASLEKPEKRFEILLEISDEPVAMFNAQRVPDRKALIPVEPAEKPEKQLRPKDKPEYEEEFNNDDFSKEAIDDFAKYTRATEHGIEILPELPEDSPARKYGARGGEIIKTINGEAVKGMSDVRRIVRTQYDAGTREFKVGYERDGVPDERTFTVPEKKTGK
jgi:membrane-associated protease RseP (regulator of RpoE activity)